jgi:hypothetical protein
MQQQLKTNAARPPTVVLPPSSIQPLPGTEPRYEPLPAEIPVDPAVLSQIESHPFFANAPPISVASYTGDSSLLGQGSVNGAMTISESSSASISRRLRKHVLRTETKTQSSTRHITCSPCRSDSVTISLQAANGLISLGYRSASTSYSPRMKPTKYTSVTRLLQVTNFSGHVYPVEVGNRFAYEEVSETKSAGFNDEATAKNACIITKKYEAKNFHFDLTGAAYLAVCEVQTVHRNNSAANSRSQSRSVFFDNLGLWTNADPVSPKERIMQGDLYGSMKDWNYSGNDTLRTISMLR